MMTSIPIKIDIVSGVLGFIVGILSLLLIIKQRQRHEKKSNLDPVTNHDPLLHWNLLEKRRGLGDLVTKVNHIAITVSDVGRSLNFYVDVLGLQQIRRPTFDRHGAWLTMGNIELHLIKGIPAIPPVDNLQVAHIAFETSNVKKVLQKLHQLNIQVRQGLSVTNAHKLLIEKSHATSKSNVVQYFFNDPDGYYIELCNCDVLNEFAFGRDLIEDHKRIPNYIKFDVVQAVCHWKNKVEKNRPQKLADIMKNIIRATEIDENKFNNLVRRRYVYGDIMQGFTDEDIKEALLKTNNFVPLTIKILAEKRGENIFFQPPSFIENGELTKPESFVMVHNTLS